MPSRLRMLPGTAGSLASHAMSAMDAIMLTNPPPLWKESKADG